MCLPLRDRYASFCIYKERFTESERKRFVSNKPNKVGECVRVVKPLMTDEEVNRWLEEYGHLGYDDLPGWLKKELSIRNLTFSPREPTELEQWETVADAREHRILHHELVIQDYMDKYKHGKSLNIIV